MQKQIRIEDMKEHSKYESNWKAYLSKQEIIDEEEADKLELNIKNKFNTYGKTGLTLDQLRRIKAIIDER